MEVVIVLKEELGIVEDPKKSNIKTDNCFEVSANLGGKTDCNPIEVERKLFPSSRKVSQKM
jgi:hypothetical protein